MTVKETGTHQTTATQKQRANKKRRLAVKSAHLAPKKAQAVTKTKGPKKTSTGAKKVGSARDGSKAAKVLEMLKRPEGASMKELIEATGWQTHSVRGFLSGAIRKKMELTVTSTKAEDGVRTYSVKS